MRTMLAVVMMLVALPSTVQARAGKASGPGKPTLRCTLGPEGTQLPSKASPKLTEDVQCTVRGGPYGAEAGWVVMLQSRVGQKPYRTHTGPLLRKASAPEATFEAKLNAGVFGKGDYLLCETAKIHAEIRRPDGKAVWQVDQTWRQACAK